MDFNTFLLRFGLNPDDFENKLLEPIHEGNNFIYKVDQKITTRECPNCHCTKCYSDGRYVSKKRCQQNEYVVDVLEINRVRLKCTKCGKKFSLPLSGIDNHSTISAQTKGFIMKEMRKPLTFEEIGKRYGFTRSAILKMFDGFYPSIPKFKLDEIICIDEIGFKDPTLNTKYVCVISSYTSRRLIDVLPSRDKETLTAYFSSIPPGELKKVKVFISDMYKGYAYIKNKFFPHAIHVVDLFHVIKDLTTTINSIRNRTLHQCLAKGSMYYNFMKKNWKQYLCREQDIADRFYTHAKTKVSKHYVELVYESIKVNQDLFDGYMILQELYKYTEYHTYEEALNYIQHIIHRLSVCGDKDLRKVGETYDYFKYEIANAFRTKDVNSHYTNAIAETLNNHIKTLIKISYGCYNFDRFRRRTLLINITKKERL